MEPKMTAPTNPFGFDSLITEDVITAAQILYKIANSRFIENNEGSGYFDSINSKGKDLDVGKGIMLEGYDLTTHKNRMKAHFLPGQNTNDDYIDEELRNNQNSLHLESTKLKIKIPPLQKESNNMQLESYHGLRSSGSKHMLPISVARLLSAVRTALVTPMKSLPSLTVDQVVDRLRSNPLDPSILECKEPFSELVRGVLKIFSTQTAPKGIMSWHPLAAYNMQTKTLKWTSLVTLAREKNEVSSESWDLILEENSIKCLAPRFPLWLTKVEPVLQLIGSLPPPPRKLMQEIDMEARFGERKKLNQLTISERSDEAIAYFHREEFIRYMIPEQSFQYTTLDGIKSRVAQLRKNSNKKFAKIRGHYVFKANRPPQFALLSLVRDAAARLPGGMGTRADICSLTKDSQYILSDTIEKTMKQIVSGALDRLRNEVDPCVEYKGENGLWFYLHSDRKEDEDFMKDGFEG